MTREWKRIVAGARKTGDVEGEGEGEGDRGSGIGDGRRETRMYGNDKASNDRVQT